MKRLEKILDIDTSTGELIPEPEKAVPATTGEPEDTDFEYARANYFEMIQQGQMALAGALRVASESENPRAYEVVGGILKNLADVNRQLLQIGEDRQRVKAARKGNVSGQPSTPQVTNNTAVFVGNSADLSKLLDSKNDK